MKYLITVFFALSMLSGTAGAEGGCPPGTYPANPPATNVCNPFPDSDSSNQPQQPKVVWETRWGAIAIDDTNSGVGFAKNMKSKRKAEKQAMAQCKSKGGNGCRIARSYYNQCGVIAWGDNGYVTASAATIETASQLGLTNCSKSTTSCKIYYADCSLPERVK